MGITKKIIVIKSKQKLKVRIKETEILDFSKATEGAILKAGWKPNSFKSIYELNARWWFREQP
ncbi:MAG: hypothetical protein Q8Q15_03605 [bacterium]|nr:hypothetical protein [bacterium]